MTTDRRSMLRAGLAFLALPGAFLASGCSQEEGSVPGESGEAAAGDTGRKGQEKDTGNPMKIQYLEIVTPDVDAVCSTYASLHGLTFGDAEPNLGGARTAKMDGGGVLGVRAPMRDDEAPVVRHYVLVKDIQATVDAAAEAGAQVALPPMELPGHGTCAIVIHGGIETGYWQD